MPVLYIIINFAIHIGTVTRYVVCVHTYYNTGFKCTMITSHNIIHGSSVLQMWVWFFLLYEIFWSFIIHTHFKITLYTIYITTDSCRCCQMCFWKLIPLGKLRRMIQNLFSSRWLLSSRVTDGFICGTNSTVFSCTSISLIRCMLS